MTMNHPCSVDVGSMIDGLMNSSEESTLPLQLFSALTDAERRQLCVHQVPVAVSLDAHKEIERELSTLEEGGETEEDDIEFERKEMMRAAAGINGTAYKPDDPLLVKQQLTKEEIIAAGKTKSRNVWSPPKNTRKAPIDHDDYDLDEETIPGLEGFMDGGGNNDDALLLAALGDTGASSRDGPGLSSVHFDNFSVEDNRNSTTATTPFPFGEASQLPRACRNTRPITSSAASVTAADRTPSTAKCHTDPEPRDNDPTVELSTSDDDDGLEEEDALALLVSCDGDAKDGAAPSINIKEELREVHGMIEEHTETEVLPFSAPASDDEGPLTAKPMNPYE